MAVPDCILIVDAENGKVLDANSKALSLFDRNEESLAGADMGDFADEAQLRKLLSRVGGNSAQGEVSLKTAVGVVVARVEAVRFQFRGRTAYQLVVHDRQCSQTRQLSTAAKPAAAIDSSRVRRLLVYHSGFVMSAALKDLLDGQDVETVFYGYPDQLEEGAGQLSEVDFLVYAIPQITDLDVTEIKKICRSHREIPALVMCLSAGNHNVVSLVKEGVKGIITSESEFHLLTAAINAIMNNELWCPRSLLLQVFENFRGLPAGGKKGGSSLLTERETEILQLIVNGYKNKEIAGQLNISYSTVINHTYNIYRKLDVNNRAGAIRFALDHNLV